MQEDIPIPDDPRIDRDPNEPIQPPGEDEPEDPFREQPIEEPDDSPSEDEPVRRDPGIDPPMQLGGETPW
ncbi:MAG TPA: hypothetical protein VF414_18825 [Thermoanaerobaculia bacterium]